MLQIVLKTISSVTLPGVVGDLFVFGSVIRSCSPRDIDLILVINESIVSPKNAYALATPLKSALGSATLLPIDLTILTLHESLKTDFTNVVEAKLIRKFESGKA
jgi:hypothetical protein